MAAFNLGESGLDVLDVRLDDGSYELVLGLEVVVDVPDRDVGRRRDVSERGPLDTLLIEQLRRGGDEPLPLGRPRRVGAAGLVLP